MNDYVLETLVTIDAEAAELETDPDDEEDGSPIVVDLVPAKMVERRRGHTALQDRLSPKAGRATLQLNVHRQTGPEHPSRRGGQGPHRPYRCALRAPSWVDVSLPEAARP